MLEINQLISDQLQWIIIAIAVIMLVLAIAVIAQGAKFRALRHKYETMMAGTGVEDLESLLVDLKNQGEMLEEGQREHKVILEAAQMKIGNMKSNLALKRYNAFGERGNDLSFSLAILDDTKTGVVLTSLHNRENSYIYSKPVQNGESQYSLSPEEKEVITLALLQT